MIFWHYGYKMVLETTFARGHLSRNLCSRELCGESWHDKEREKKKKKKELQNKRASRNLKEEKSR